MSNTCHWRRLPNRSTALTHARSIARSASAMELAAGQSQRLPGVGYRRSQEVDPVLDLSAFIDVAKRLLRSEDVEARRDDDRLDLLGVIRLQSSSFIVLALVGEGQTEEPAGNEYVVHPPQQ